MRRGLTLFLISTCLLACPVWGQRQEGEPETAGPQQLPGGLQTQDPAGRPVGSSLLQASFTNSGQDYLLGAGDIIEVSVIGIPGLEPKDYTLDGQGRISLPYLNQVRLLGLTAREAQVKIAAQYEVSLLEDPQVSVRIKEFKSQYYYVLGAVNKSGRFQLTRQTSLLDALTLAGGLTDKADVRILIYHDAASQPSRAIPADPANPAQETSGAAQEINLADLLTLTDPRRNYVVQSGDIINVPERKQGLYFVLGDIQKPGAFPIAANEKPMLSMALAHAGGPLGTAASNKTMIIRPRPGSDLPEQIKVDAIAVLKGEVRDIELQENDIVLVPGSASKTLGKTFLQGLNSFLASAMIIAIR